MSIEPFPNEVWTRLFDEFPAEVRGYREPLAQRKVRFVKDLRLVCRVFDEVVTIVQNSRGAKVSISIGSAEDVKTVLGLRSLHTLKLAQHMPPNEVQMLFDSAAGKSVQAIYNIERFLARSWEIVAKLPALKKVTFTDTGCFSNVKTFLLLFKKIEEIEIDLRSVPADQLLPTLSELKNLRKIKIKGPNLTVEQVRALQSALPQLKELETELSLGLLSYLPDIVTTLPEGCKTTWMYRHDTQLKHRCLYHLSYLRRSYPNNTRYPSLIHFFANHYSLAAPERPLLLEHLTPECADSKGLEPLLGASVKKLDIQMVTHLLNLGVDPNCRIEDDGIVATSLTYLVNELVPYDQELEDAELEACKTLISLLLSNGADPNIASSKRVLPLQRAVAYANPWAVEQLLTAKVPANPNLEVPALLYVYTNLPGTFSTLSPLHIAYNLWLEKPESEARKECVQLLLAHGANVHVRDDKEQSLFTCLMLAKTAFPFKHVQETLIAKGAFVKEKSEEYAKALMSLLEELFQRLEDDPKLFREKLRYMEFFVDEGFAHGFTFDLWDAKTLRLLCLVAKTYDVPKLASFLESKGYKETDEEYFSAIRLGQLASLHLLSSEQIALMQDSSGFSLLHCAAEEGALEAVGLILCKGGDTKALTKSDFTASHLAALRGHNEVVLELVRHEALQITALKKPTL